ncbi:LysR substrate-binding domain-containing protein [Vibrio breoganii]|uniref:LysR substrate-binding domain-containing protein n=1 Tax=Vibrio breoganii TaxID=553239 RepID=UPI000C84D365|nr:LysR substrate-binding domain-containing protein [Vibrio breoganii]PMJ49934.1 LysR family transcriptional regulator [Vibrio breoganii]PMK54493.1 LysR family transcriptional regulator [Vibrio breoganii]PML35963.1 LysR family transcriptional regulator [Vibrio breoganii]PMM89456.1 LysR family transcriptional regulator [Vibrio breoganii]PMO23972.1 LysR family transcriptional regulator [Vibrio breoganii]
MSQWEGIEEFVAVADSESFTKAALVLDTSVAQISRRLSALEARLGVKLVHRTTRRVSVTDVGLGYAEHCRMLLDGLAEAEREVTESHSLPIGRLRITAPTTYGESVIAPLLMEFVALYPQLELDLQLSNDRLDLIADKFDIAIRIGELPDSTLIAKKLSERQQYVCASPDYIAEYGEALHPSQLADCDCLLSSSSTWRFLENNKKLNLTMRGSFRCNSGNVLTAAALQGKGVVQLPDFYVASHIEKNNLVELLPDYRCEREPIWALYPQNRHLSPKVKMAIEFLSEKLAQGTLPSN